MNRGSGSSENLEKIFEIHTKSISNLDVTQNKKIIISFSAPFAAGKTTVAKQLEDRYQAVRINNDDIRDIIKINHPEVELQPTLLKYLEYLFEKINEFDNTVVILDSSIDRKYAAVKELAEKNKFGLFIIKMVVTPELIIERVKKRNPENAEDFIASLDDLWSDYQAFDQNVVNFFYEDNMEELFSQLDDIFNT